MKQFEARARWAFTLVAFFGCVSCATQTSYDTTAQRPPLVLVYDFHASPNTAFENSRLIAQGTSDFSSASTEARQAALGELVRKRIREKLVDGINGMGLPTRWGDPSTPAPIGTLVIRGDFSTTSADNRGTREIIEFAKDKSIVDTEIYALGVLSLGDLRPLFHVSTDAETAAMPELIGNEDQSGASKSSRSARAAADAEHLTLDAYRSRVDELVNETTGQALASLSQYFANQGWISRDQVRAPSF